MLVEAIIISILGGFLLNKGKKDFDSITIKGIVLVFMAAIIEGVCQFLITHSGFGLADIVRKYTLLIEVAVYLLLFIFIYMNREKKGMKIVMLGMILNSIAVISNNGYMMVDGQILLDMGFLNSYNELKEGMIFAHDLVDLNTKFVYLADIINITPPYPFPKSISFGDLVLDLGVFIVVINVFKESLVTYKRV